MKAKRPRIRKYSKVTIAPFKGSFVGIPFSDVPLIMYDPSNTVKVKHP